MKKNIIMFIHRRKASGVLQISSFFKEHGALFSLMVLGLVVRIWVIFGQGSYWFDEAITVGIAQKPLNEFWHYLQYENSPPLYFLLLKGWGMVFGLGEHATRFFSALIGTAAIPVMYLLGKEFFDKRTGIITAAVVSVSSFVVYYTIEARMYSLVFLFSALSFYFFLRLMAESAPRLSKIFFWGYFFVTLAALYASITALSLLLIQAVFLLFFGWQKKNAWYIWLAMASALACYAPWLLHLALMKFHLHQAGLLLQGWYFKRSDDLPLIGALLLFLLYYLPVYHPLLLACSFLSAGVFIFAAAWYKDKEATLEKKASFDRRFALLLLCLVLPLLLSTFTLNLWRLQYYLPSAICFYLLFSNGASHLLRSSKKTVRMCACIILGLILFFNIANLLLIRELDGVWDRVADVAKVQKADVIVTDLLGGALSYRMDPSLPPIVMLTSRELPREKNQGQFDQLLYTIQYNWLYSVEGKDELRNIAEQIQIVLLKNPQRIVFVYFPLPKNEFVRAMLIRRGFDCKDILLTLPIRENFDAVFCKKR